MQTHTISWMAITVLVSVCVIGERSVQAQPYGLSNATVASGLKEALQVGTQSAVDLTGRPDGYFRNAAIKILMPSQLRPIEKGLRAVGYGAQVGEFILSMNRTAERAAPAAKQIFWDARKPSPSSRAKPLISTVTSWVRASMACFIC